MDSGQFDSIARTLADRRRSRRQVLAAGAAGLATGALTMAGSTGTASAQEATPTPLIPITLPELDSASETEYLFVQSYGRSRITTRPNDGAGDHTITLEAGLGQTIYFSNRPERIAGSVSTPEFLGNLGFSNENPPNAALVLSTGDAEQEFAVVELFNPHYDPDTASATYDLEVLQQWVSDGITLAEEPKDLAELQTEFGTTHLFIDGCVDQAMYCADHTGHQWGRLGQNLHQFCWLQDGCYPCSPDLDDPDSIRQYWSDVCNSTGRAVGMCNQGCSVSW